MPTLTTMDFEGYSPTIYQDTVGKNTIGYGFNIDEKAIRELMDDEVLKGNRPITREESDEVFKVLHARARDDAINFLGYDSFIDLDDDKQNVMVDMAYNLGSSRLSKFKKMKKAIIDKDYNRAADEMVNSKWYNQVGRRSKHHVNVFRQGANL